MRLGRLALCVVSSYARCGVFAFARLRPVRATRSSEGQGGAGLRRPVEHDGAARTEGPLLPDHSWGPKIQKIGEKGPSLRVGHFLLNPA